MGRLLRRRSRRIGKTPIAGGPATPLCRISGVPRGATWAPNNTYYHESRTHLALEKDTPDSRKVHTSEMGTIVQVPEVGGLHHRYERRAAERSPGDVRCAHP